MYARSTPLEWYVRARLNMFLSRLAARDVLHGKLRPKLTMPPVSVNQNFVDRLYVCDWRMMLRVNVVRWRLTSP